MREEKNMYRVLMGKPEGKRPLGRPRHRWGDGIRVDLRETGLRGIEWMQLAQDRGRWRSLVNTVMNWQVLLPQSQSLFVTFFIYTFCVTIWEIMRMYVRRQTIAFCIFSYPD
jgi:hypothetical protein